MVGCSVHLTLLHTDFIPGFVCSADLLWNHDPPQIVPLCQAGAKEFYKLSEKPLISMALGDPDGATMHCEVSIDYVILGANSTVLP